MFYQNDHITKMIKEREIQERIREAETDRMLAASQSHRSNPVGQLVRQTLHSFGHLFLKVGNHLDRVETRDAGLARQ